MIVITDSYTKLNKAIQTIKRNSTTITCIFIDEWLANDVITSQLLNDKGPRLLSKLFFLVRSTVAMKNSAITEYQPDFNGPVERFNSTLILWLR